MDPQLVMEAATRGMQATAGTAQIIGGLIGQGKTNRELRANQAKRPTYRMQAPVKNAYRVAESRASTGLSDESLKNFQQASQRSLTASIDGLIRGGSHLNSVGALYGANQAGIQRMALTDDAMRAENTQALFQRGDVMTDALDKEWQVNTWAPWTDKQQALVKKLEQNKQMVSQGINNVVGAAANTATSKSYEKENDNVYGGTFTGPSATHFSTAGIQPSNAGQAAVMGFKAMEAVPERGVPAAQPAATGYEGLYNKFPGLFMKY